MKNEGRFDFCQGCTVNCYFEPSFAFPTNLYAISSLTSNLNTATTSSSNKKSKSCQSPALTENLSQSQKVINAIDTCSNSHSFH